jgi:DNA helicase-2/ATP-dependent DNA helicase PcrA
MMQLNPEQQKAVEHGDGPLLILAGAGSGKTRVLVHRVAHLIEMGRALPSEILSVTFTNKAAGEMRRRLEGMLGFAVKDLWVETFHAACLRILRRHSEHVGLGPHFVVYDDADQLALIRNVLEALGISEKAIPPRRALERISRAKDSCLSPEQFEDRSKDFYLQKIARIYTKYQLRLVEAQAVDFGDIIRLTVRLFEEHPEILERYQRRWKYLLIDEYQDTNHAQYRFVSLLAKAHGNVSVVGDDDQSIYRWRGADISNILSFERDFPGARVIRLEQNYRSTKTILAAANGVIENNSGRKPKTLWTQNPDGKSVRVVESATERQEAEEVARGIRAARDGGAEWRDIAVFYRINAQSRPFEDVFRREGIPYQIVGGVRFYERREIKDVIAYLRVVHDSRDDVGIARIINVPARRIGKETVKRLRAYADANGGSLYDSIPRFCNSGTVQGAVAKRLRAFHELIGSLKAAAEGAELSAVLRDVLDRTGYVEALVGEKTDEANERIENIGELVAAANEYSDTDERSGLAAFLDQVALVSDVDGFDDGAGAVTLMTLHLAKGLEFPSVYMVGMEENLFPHVRSLDDPDELEEERRLCYVGMTRAQKQLTMLYALKRFHFGQNKYALASRFLDEIPEEYVEWERKRDYVNGFFPSQRRPVETACDDTTYVSDDFDQRPPEERMEQGFHKGQRIAHPAFGHGVIKSCERTPSGHKVVVQFRGGLTKRLIAELANLVPV